MNLLKYHLEDKESNTTYQNTNNQINQPLNKQIQNPSKYIYNNVRKNKNIIEITKREGNYYFISGRSCNLSHSDSLIIETEDIMSQIKYQIEQSQFQMKDIYLVYIYLKDITNFSIVNSIYGKYFQTLPPAR
jgi:enamine deaminase RidA (YjgF/YER057c/UK114 family)